MDVVVVMDDHGDVHDNDHVDSYDAGDGLGGWSALDTWPIVTATLAPLSAALSISSLLVLHSYRLRWRTVDLFLVTLVVQQLLIAILHFGRAVVALTATTSESHLIVMDTVDTCPLFVWASLTLRTFQVTTVTSLVLDRAFALRWPDAYRVNVRRNQVRYHIVVLTVVSFLVGIASSFARIDEDGHTASSDVSGSGSGSGSGTFTWSWSRSTSTSGSGSDTSTWSSVSLCILMPIFLDRKFVLFVSSLHGLLALVSVMGLVDVTARLATHSSTSTRRFDGGTITPSPSLRVDHVRLPVTTFHNGGQKHHQQHHQQQQQQLQQQHYRRPLLTASVPDMFWSTPAVLRVSGHVSAPLPPSATSSIASTSLRRRSTAAARLSAVRLGDLRWATVATIAVTANLVNHLPYLALLILGRWFNGTSSGLPPPSYLDGATTCLALLDGLLLPVILWAVDPTYRTAVANYLTRRMSRKAGKSPSTSYFGGSDHPDVDVFSGLESLSCSTLPRRCNGNGNSIGPNGYSPASIVSTYSSMTSANGYACSSTLDKKVLLMSDSGPRSWTPQPRPREATATATATAGVAASAMTFEHLRVKLQPPDYSLSSRPRTGRSWNLDSDKNGNDGEVVTVEKMKFMTQLDCDTEEHIYATLRDHMSLTSEKDVAMAMGNDLDDGHQDGDDRDDDNDGDNDDVDDDDSDSSSFTTSASDDFEFHLTRPVPPATATMSSSPSRASTMSIKSSSNHTLYAASSDVTELVQKLTADRTKSSSLSMNDLDLLDLSEHENREVAKSEATGHDTLDRPLTAMSPKQPKLKGCSKNLFEDDDDLSSNTKRRQYLRNPLLMRGRFANRPRSRAACFIGFYGSNWKYRPTVLPRKYFPWKPTAQPFPDLKPKLDSPMTTSKITTTSNVSAYRPPPYRKTFISDFL